MSGKFIVFEGKDGTGKSTLARLVSEELERRGYSAPFVGFPSSEGSIGAFIRSNFTNLTFDKRAFLPLMIADAIDWEDRITRVIADGGIFIADRYTTFSAFVYQTESYPFEVVNQVFAAFSWRKPDMAFLVDVPVEVSMDRMRARSKRLDLAFESEEFEHNARLRLKYLSLFDRYEGPACVLDGTKSPEELTQEVLKALKI